MQPYFLPPSMSSSKSSSSYVKNPYDSSSNTFEIRRKNTSNLEYEYLGMKCKCDFPFPCQESWKEGILDPGKRCFRCSQYKDPSKKCNFFVWANPSYPKRSREVIKELKSKLKKKDDDLQSARVDVNFSDRKMLVLHEEVCLLRKK